MKENIKYQKIFSPKLSLKIAPENNTRDISKEKEQIDVNSIFNLERISSTVEGGASLAYGADYSIFSKKFLRNF